MKKSKSNGQADPAPTIILKQGSHYAFDLESMMAFATTRSKKKRADMIANRGVVKVVSPCLEIKIVDGSKAPFLLVEFGSGSRVWILVD